MPTLCISRKTRLGPEAQNEQLISFHFLDSEFKFIEQ